MIKFKTLLPQAWKNVYHGINAALANVYYGHPGRALTVIGVTGTDGKTTTSTLIYTLLKTAGFKVALISTVAAYIGAVKVNTGFHVTTPDPWALQKLIRQIKRSGFTHLVLEATSHGLDQHRLAGINISIAVVTNVTPEHLDYHRTFSNYLKAKAKIYTQAKLIILNADAAAYESLRLLVPKKAKLLTYSLRHPGVHKTVITHRFSESYNQSNALGMVTLGEALGLESQVIDQALMDFPGIPGRMQLIPNHLGFNIVVDFAHTPNALKVALEALRSKSPGKLIAVFGCAGERDPNKRPLMGGVAARLADEVILTAEDPRGENIYTIIHQILSGVTTNHGHIHALVNRGEAIRLSLKLAQKGDTIGIFGKGHEQSLNLDGLTEIPCSDKGGVQEALTEKL